MKGLLMVAVFVFLTAVVSAEVTDENFRLETGWTPQKEEMMKSWSSFSSRQRISVSSDLNSRIENLIPLLPEDEYSAGEGKYVGYRSRLVELQKLFNEDPDEINYSELASCYEEASVFVDYTERNRYATQNPDDNIFNMEDQTFATTTENIQYSPFSYGWGWDSCRVSTGVFDVFSCYIASYQNYVFVAGSRDDTLLIWRSTNYGYTWSRWFSYKDSYARLSSGLQIDPYNLDLLYLYTRRTTSSDYDIYFRKFTNFNDPNQYTYSGLAATSGVMEKNPFLVANHCGLTPQMCCVLMEDYYIVIKRSTDGGVNWTTVYTYFIDNYNSESRGASGAAPGTPDGNIFYFVSKYDNSDKLLINESSTGASGSWTSTVYDHPGSGDLEDFDVSASHNRNKRSLIIPITYEWSSGDRNLRVLFRLSQNRPFYYQTVDGDQYNNVEYTKVACDAEFKYGNHTTSDFYHLYYFKEFTNTYAFSLRCLNDSASIDNWVKDNPSYFERVGTHVIDTFCSPVSCLYLHSDITTVWNTPNGQWFPIMLWSWGGQIFASVPKNISYFTDAMGYSFLSPPDTVYPSNRSVIGVVKNNGNYFPESFGVRCRVRNQNNVLVMDTTLTTKLVYSGFYDTLNFGYFSAVSGQRYYIMMATLLAGDQNHSNDTLLKQTLCIDSINAVEEISPVSPVSFSVRYASSNIISGRLPLRLALPTASEVKILVYDITGRSVSREECGILESGYHELVWSGKDENGNQIPAGVYFFILDAGKDKHSGKIIIAE
ncbi:hypothetical protein JXA84_03350 [candidate division WOR-3 bacterium]|nr:hypothetical protein [candidate division WOR-3 bacterium]